MVTTPYLLPDFSFRAGRLAVVSAESFQLVERLADQLGKVPLVAIAHPAFEGDLKNGNPRLGRQTRGWFLHSALAQCLRYRRSEGCELDQLALSKLGIR